jgi:quercetin dioxygenase-like cupin family protein
MNITRRADALRDLTPMGAEHFTGKAGVHPLTPTLEPLPPTSASVVRFEVGVRSNWHAHAGGQLLVAIEGEGWVQARGGEPQPISIGDAVVTEANEQHWHGAGRGGPFAHVVVNLGETRWLEESPPPPD